MLLVEGFGRTWDEVFLVRRCDRSRYVSCAARPRGVASRFAWYDRARFRLRDSGLADRGTMLPGSVRGLGRCSGGTDERSDVGRPRDGCSSAGRSARFGRGFLIEPPGPIFAILIIIPFLLIQMMPIHLRWKVNSLRVRGEMVLMKSIEYMFLAPPKVDVVTVDWFEVQILCFAP
ncbi:unnamed protein product [Microthlaspi erraticum]|uniref:Uncharacterized protein n=1 Tax=Microthlaspi erraticum TaxID=1685480 RepID=A0A6D2JT55_9BRAS|nr:unnamed protein product [Microthlaspi erraticum]